MRVKHMYKRAISAEVSWIALRVAIAWAVIALVVVVAVIIPAGLAAHAPVVIEPTASTGP